jgi:ABC-type branched-subunit amino acid transport system ATPase component
MGAAPTAPASLDSRAQSAPAMLEVRGVSKAFGGLRALSACSLEVHEREIAGLIGPNGSGKTTLFNILAGYMPLDDGEVIYRGHSLLGLRPYQIARRGIGRTFQVTRIFPKMTLLENLVLPAGAVDRSDKARELLELVGLAAFSDEYANDLSFGQQRLLSIIQVLMLDPALILLDEPAAGVNPTMQNKIVDLIHYLNGQGKTFLIIEHNMDLVMRICSPVIVMTQGRVIASGSPDAVRNDPRVLDAYLGEVTL